MILHRKISVHMIILYVQKRDHVSVPDQVLCLTVKDYFE